MAERRGALRRIYRAGLYTCVIAVAVLAFAPLDAPPLPSHDKINHLLAFAVLAWLAEGAYPGKQRAWARLGWLLAYGLLIEVIQHHLPYRQFSWVDFAADVLGVSSYVAAANLAAGARRILRAQR